MVSVYSRKGLMIDRQGSSGVFFFQAEDGIRDYKVTGVQTCALPILIGLHGCDYAQLVEARNIGRRNYLCMLDAKTKIERRLRSRWRRRMGRLGLPQKIGRASGRGRG